jgi:hypothetical protein
MSITPEEKDQIIERLRLESDLRKELQGEQEPKKRSRFAWVESKIGILIVGALVSGILVPIFQYTQETIKWRRQNRYENVKYRVGMMREGIKEFVFVHEFIAEAYEQARPLVENPVISQKDIDDYNQKQFELQSKRFQQNAKFASLVIYFPETNRGNLRQTYNDYLTDVQVFMGQLKTAVGIRSELLKKQSESSSEQLRKQFEEIQTQLDGAITKLNQKYEEVLQLMKVLIGESENESENYM